MRLAREAGDISSLIPHGIPSLADAPYTLVEAIAVALHFLSFREMPENERPPRWKWLDPERMEVHWEMVQANRAAKAGGHGDLADMPQNEYASELLRRAQRRDD